MPPEWDLALLALGASAIAAGFFAFQARRRIVLAICAGLAAVLMIAALALAWMFVVEAFPGERDAVDGWLPWCLLGGVAVFWLFAGRPIGGTDPSSRRSRSAQRSEQNFASSKQVKTNPSSRTRNPCRKRASRRPQIPIG